MKLTTFSSLRPATVTSCFYNNHCHCRSSRPGKTAIAASATGSSSNGGNVEEEEQDVLGGGTIRTQAKRGIKREACLSARRRESIKLLQLEDIAASGDDVKSAHSESIGQQSDLFSAGSRPSHCYGRRNISSIILLPFLLPHVNVARAAESNEAVIIRNGVRNILSKAKAAGMLRLVFHDAGTFDMDDKSGGMNGSIIYEVGRPENAGLSKSVKILGKAKGEIDRTQQVSWADLIAVAGAEAVAFCGGPEIPVRLGRIDSRSADPAGKLPEETLDATGLKRCFSKKGFSTQELVVLSGAHTIGSKGFGNPNVFDNSYFKVLLERPWTSSPGMSGMIGLPTDWALAEDDECLRWINIYAEDQAKFFDDFRTTYIKLVNSGASWRTI